MSSSQRFIACLVLSLAAHLAVVLVTARVQPWSASTTSTSLADVQPIVMLQEPDPTPPKTLLGSPDAPDSPSKTWLGHDQGNDTPTGELSTVTQGALSPAPGVTLEYSPANPPSPALNEPMTDPTTESTPPSPKVGTPTALSSQPATQALPDGFALLKFLTSIKPSETNSPTRAPLVDGPQPDAPSATTPTKPSLQVGQPSPPQSKNKPRPEMTPNQLPGQPSESSSTPSTDQPIPVRPDGRPLSAKGLRIITVQPRVTTLMRATMPIRNPLVRVRFGPDGKVREADFVPGRDVGIHAWNESILDAVYRWRAQGKELDEIPTGDPRAGISVDFLFILTRGD
ncbi:MAG: hypothetical protein IPK69_05770 [Phycisphaerales bacterium]|nr:MAG: hypothetical protein IPK69_05770 [Phycisphaerales bacterium]